jgi:hypothetical protein
MVHEKLLYDHARFLLEKYNSAIMEGKEHVIYLPEEDTDTITRLVDWLYRKAIPLEKLLALDLYYLAEKFCISALMNQLMDKFRDNHATTNAIFTTWDVQEIYHNTHEMSRLRFYSAAQIACSLRQQRHRRSWVAAESEKCSKFSPDVFRDVFHILINHWDDVHDDGTWPNTETSRNAFGTCDFHAHEKGEKCNGTQ